MRVRSIELPPHMCAKVQSHKRVGPIEVPPQAPDRFHKRDRRPILQADTKSQFLVRPIRLGLSPNARSGNRLPRSKPRRGRRPPSSTRRSSRTADHSSFASQNERSARAKDGAYLTLDAKEE